MDRYSVFYRCTNCYETVLVWIPKGKEAPEYFDCPNCGLSRLNKTEKKYSPSVDKYDMVSEFEIVRRK
jgi:DNA-directed RNA polymerase subunit RPC12/RpoP